MASLVGSAAASGTNLVRTYRPWFHVQPRVSLLAGSVLVLLTLYAPVAFQACGPAQTGGEFLAGHGIWPGMASPVHENLERGLYALGVALAGFTLLLLLATWRRPARLESRWINWPFAAAGLISLFAVADFFWLVLAALVGDFLERRFGVDRQEVIMPVVDAIAILVMALCLRSRLLRSQRWIVWLFGIESVVCLLAIATGLLEQFHLPFFLSPDAVARMSASPGLLYWLVPVGLWYRFGLTRNEDRRSQWPALRRRLIALYLPVGIFAGLVFLWTDVRAQWGVAPYLAGLTLIFLGYTELAHGTIGWDSHPAESRATSLTAVPPARSAT